MFSRVVEVGVFFAHTLSDTRLSSLGDLSSVCGAPLVFFVFLERYLRYEKGILVSLCDLTCACSGLPDTAPRAVCVLKRKRS